MRPAVLVLVRLDERSEAFPVSASSKLDMVECSLFGCRIFRKLKVLSSFSKTYSYVNVNR